VELLTGDELLVAEICKAELEAEALGVPYDEVLKRLEEESRHSGGRDERGVQEEVAF
jgi:hypothetical protein